MDDIDNNSNSLEWTSCHQCDPKDYWSCPSICMYGYMYEFTFFLCCSRLVPFLELALMIHHQEEWWLRPIRPRGFLVCHTISLDMHTTFIHLRQQINIGQLARVYSQNNKIEGDCAKCIGSMWF